MTEFAALAWSALFTSEVSAFSPSFGAVSNAEVFSSVYTHVVHSRRSSETLLRIERSHAEAMEAKCRARDSEVKATEDRQRQEMDAAVQRAAEGGEGNSEAAVNSLASAHAEELQLCRLRWESELQEVRETQRREFRQWVMAVAEDETKGEPAASAAGVCKSESAFSLSSAASLAPCVLQESFTITLGAQMKQMHNIRIVAADALRLCSYVTSESDPEDAVMPQRLQTAMSLYSNNLCGLVMLTEDVSASGEGCQRSRALVDLCQRSTEFHFPSIEQQLAAIREEECLGSAVRWRAEHKKKLVLENPDEQSPEPAAPSNERKRVLKQGDFYVTRHSNLCEMHVLFHLVSDPSSVSNSNINSRHPVVMGLRNVLKTASLSDVTTVTLPLLLAHEMTEAMTVQWCMKRAELVFKCVKGFMMEVASWGGSEIKTLQFLVPKDIDPELFSRLTTMLSGIFRTSNPIRGK